MILKELRIKNNLTQKQLSEKTGIPKRTIEDYESGIRKLTKASAENVYRLTDVLGISMDDFMIRIIEEEKI